MFHIMDSTKIAFLYFKKDSNKAIYLSIIFFIALVIRLCPTIDYPELFRGGFGPFGDTPLYHKIAYNIYKGNGFSGIDDGSAFGLDIKNRGNNNQNYNFEPAIVRGPVYPFFLFAVYKLSGNEEDMKQFQTWHLNLNKVRFVQSVLDATICILVFFMVRIIYPSSVWPALLSAYIYCFSYYNIYLFFLFNWN